ncbi:MAG: methyltransferase domain-containing protein, partial [Solirubrobacterales bacterium]|nr:methyltransferase domain-containing protein [Solirubrobacterales bacterium]
MAELTTGCCRPAAQETCCEQDDKASCCGETRASGCGCAAGSEPALTAATDSSPEDLHETVRLKYAQAATAAARGEYRQAQALESDSGTGDGDFFCCSPADRTGVFGSALYDEPDREQVPPTAVQASLGCGVPTAVADLREGEIVLDLGSGAGADVLISARRVGPTGKAIGLDMTDEMLELARANAREAGVENAEF